MNMEELKASVLKIFPRASFGEDNDGQVVIYTNMYCNDNPPVYYQLEEGP